MNKKILELRKKLDKIDEEMLKLLEKRMNIIKSVGKIKSKLNIPIEDIERENDIIKRLFEHSGKNVTEGQLIKIFKSVFQSSKIEQKKINKKK